MKRAVSAASLLASIALTCAIAPTPFSCSTTTCNPARGWALIALAVLVGFAAIAVIARAAYATEEAHRELLLAPRFREPAVDSLTAQLSIDPVVCIESGERFAVCAGTVRPRIYVSRGLVAASGPSELLAILVHEAHHARRRDPLRRAIRQGAAATLFCLPIVRWWADRASVADELAADRAAVARCGVRPLARALLISAGAAPNAHASFGGAASTRVRTLNGEPVVRERPAVRLWAHSAAGALAIALSLACVFAAPLVG